MLAVAKEAEEEETEGSDELSVDKGVVLDEAIEVGLAVVRVVAGLEAGGDEAVVEGAAGVTESDSDGAPVSSGMGATPRESRGKNITP